MPTRELLSPAQRAQFLSLPAEMSEQMLARYYTLSSEDLVRIRRHRRSHNKLGFSVQLAYLRFPGRTWTASEGASPLVVSYIANQLKVNPMGIVQYASEREATRFEHLAELQKAYCFRQFTTRDYRELSAWLMPLALSTDAGPALVGALIEEMRDRKIIIPGITTVERLGWEVRRRAEQQVFRLLTEGLTDLQRMQLQALLTVPAASRQTLLVWLRQPPGAASPANFLKVVERLRWIRELVSEIP
jgi:TnpA family transposase